MKARHLVLVTAVFAAMFALWVGIRATAPDATQTANSTAQMIQPF